MWTQYEIKDSRPSTSRNKMYFSDGSRGRTGTHKEAHLETQWEGYVTDVSNVRSREVWVASEKILGQDLNGT